MRPYFISPDGMVTLYLGDASAILPMLAEASVQLVATSPPYLGQRQYGNHLAEIGREDDPSVYLRILIEVTAMIARTVHSRGSIFVNLGDKYNADGPVKNVTTAAGYERAPRQPRYEGMSLKSLMMLPSRYAIGCIDQLGLALRAEIIWLKGAGGADGKARDRVRRAHELIYHFSHGLKHGEAIDAFGDVGSSVWSIPTRGKTGGHTADFPVALPYRIISTWSLPGHRILDPFCGSGTTLVVARDYDRRSVGIDLERSALDETIARLGY